MSKMQKSENTLKKNDFFQLSVLLISTGLVLTGCGEFSYKRGASANDFQQAKQSCQQASGSASEVDHCLKQQGWLVVSPDKPLTPEADQAVFGQSAAPALAGPTVNAKIDVKATDDPREKVTINSWWKVGAGAAQLAADSKECVDKLGEDYAPKANYTLVTKGLLECMSEKGWYAIQAPASMP